MLSLVPGGIGAEESDASPVEDTAGVEHEFSGFAWLNAGDPTVGSVTTRVTEPDLVADDEPLRLVGTLTEGDEPVAGAEIEYAEAEDGPFSTVETDDQGRFFFPTDGDEPLTLEDSELATEDGHVSYLLLDLELGGYDLDVQLVESGEGPGSIARLSGDGRVDTAVAVSQEAFPAGADTAFIATGYEFPDALTGGPAADQLGGPILLAGEDFLPEATAAELERLEVDEIVIFGGELAIDADVASELYAYGDVSRLSGGERFATAAEIATSVYEPGVETVYVATGMEPWDALSGGAAAALTEGPVLLAAEDLLPDSTVEALETLAPENIAVLGGTEAINDDVLAALGEFADVERLSGTTRFDTSAAIAEATFAADAVDTVYVATGEEWADALTGVPGAAAADAPVLLTGHGMLPEVIADELARLGAEGAGLDINVLGGSAAVSDDVFDELADFVVDGVLDLDYVDPVGETATAAVDVVSVPDNKQSEATGTGGAVSSLDPWATQAGINVLRRGGNAVDAAVATSAMLGVTRPYDGSIGGGGYFVIYLEEEDRVITIDHREKAPAAFDVDSFHDEDGVPIPWSPRVTSGLSVGVPGVVLGWEEALDNYGTMTLDQLLEAPAQVAAQGFEADGQYQSRTESNITRFRNFSSTIDTFLNEDGEAPQEGDLVQNPELAHAYDLISADGSSAFYTGEMAETIADTVQNPPVVDNPDWEHGEIIPGLMTAEDLANYDVSDEDPTLTDYRDYQVYGMGPSSSGGTTMGQAMKLLEQIDDYGDMDRADALHYLAQGTAIGFADRGAYLGDPAFVDVPVEGLVSEGYAEERFADIGEGRPEDGYDPGDPWPHDSGDGEAVESVDVETEEYGSTTHLSTADADGNVVSYTFTIEQIGGSGLAVPGYGFLLNNELTDFDVADTPAETAELANAPGSEKRPRSSMSPTIVLSDEGEPVLSVGAPGGIRIITSVYQVTVNHLDFGMTLPEAIEEPRISDSNAATVPAEPEFLEGPYADALEARGYEFAETGTLANVHGISFLPDGQFQAAAEGRRLDGGSAMVVDEQ